MMTLKNSTNILYDSFWFAFFPLFLEKDVY